MGLAGGSGIAYCPEAPRGFLEKPWTRMRCYAGKRNAIKYVQRVSIETSLEKDFNRLAAAWKADSKGPQSSLSRIVTHPAYLEIISRGEQMIPFILRDLEREPHFWFTALRILAKQFSPVKAKDVGNIKKMTEAWLEWGRNNGKIS